MRQGHFAVGSEDDDAMTVGHPEISYGADLPHCGEM